MGGVRAGREVFFLFSPSFMPVLLPSFFFLFWGGRAYNMFVFFSIFLFCKVVSSLLLFSFLSVLAFFFLPYFGPLLSFFFACLLSLFCFFFPFVPLPLPPTDFWLWWFVLLSFSFRLEFFRKTVRILLRS